MLPGWRYYELHQPVSLPEDGVGQAERNVRKAEWLVARQAALIARLEKERDPVRGSHVLQDALAEVRVRAVEEAVVNVDGPALDGLLLVIRCRREFGSRRRGGETEAGDGNEGRKGGGAGA